MCVIGFKSELTDLQIWILNTKTQALCFVCYQVSKNSIFFLDMSTAEFALNAHFYKVP